MKRITESNPYWMGEEMWASACEPDDEMMEEVYCKLWSYENTGLDPEEICSRASQWISVKDRLPDTSHTMLVCTKNRNGVYKVAIAYYENDFGWCGSGGRWGNVTHWMPLPEPPKEE